MAIQHNEVMREVVICNACKGWGEIDMSDDDRTVMMKPCSACGGGGRLVKRTEINYSRINNGSTEGNPFSPRKSDDQQH